MSRIAFLKDQYDTLCRVMGTPKQESDLIWQNLVSSGLDLTETEVAWASMTAYNFSLMRAIEPTLKKAAQVVVDHVKQSTIKEHEELQSEIAELREFLNAFHAASESEVQRVEASSKAAVDQADARIRELQASTVKDLSARIAEASTTAFTSRARTLNLRDMVLAGAAAALVLLGALTAGWSLGYRSGVQAQIPALAGRADAGQLARILTINPDIGATIARNCARTAPSCTVPLWLQPPAPDGNGNAVASLSSVIPLLQDYSLWLLAALGLMGLWHWSRKTA